MKLSLATYFLVNFFLTLKCPYTDASEIRTRRPKKIRDAKPLPITEILQKCKKLNQVCNTKRKCCNGLTCKKEEGKPRAKCAEEPKYFKLQQEMLLQYSDGDIVAASMSHDGNTVLVQGKDVSQTHILSGLFQSPVLVPGFSDMIIHQGFSPLWTNCVSGDGNVIAISNYFARIVRVYKLTTDSDINENGWNLLGEEINGNDLGGSLDWWDNFGSSLALSFNGDILIVGADYADKLYEGALQRFEFIEDAWVSVGKMIDGQYINDQIGRFPLQMSKDTSRILVGGGRNGFASVYDWNEKKKDWSLVERFEFGCEGWSDCVCDRSCFEEDSSDQYPYFGMEENFLSSDGNIVAIGDYNYDPMRKEGVESKALRGAIHFFQWKNNEFVEFAEKLVGPRKAELGWTFGMSDNGQTLVNGNYDKGEVYHYKKVGKKYKKYATIATGGFNRIFLSGDGTKLTVTSTKSDDQVDTYTLE